MEEGKIKNKKSNGRFTPFVEVAQLRNMCAQKSDLESKERGRSGYQEGNHPQLLLTLVHQRANMSLEPRCMLRKEAKTLRKPTNLST